jgi:hypothetical protein
MAKLNLIRKSPAFQSAEDAVGALALFVLLYVGLALTGTA